MIEFLITVSQKVLNQHSINQINDVIGQIKKKKKSIK